MIHTVKGFGVDNKAEVDVFLERFCFFDDPTEVGNLISGSSDFSKPSLFIWKFSIQVMLKILQARLQQYVNLELPDVQAGFRKGKGTRDPVANICWITEKARESHKNLLMLH